MVLAEQLSGVVSPPDLDRLLAERHAGRLRGAAVAPAAALVMRQASDDVPELALLVHVDDLHGPGRPDARRRLAGVARRLIEQLAAVQARLADGERLAHVLDELSGLVVADEAPP